MSKTAYSGVTSATTRSGRTIYVATSLSAALRVSDGVACFTLAELRKIKSTPELGNLVTDVKEVFGVGTLLEQTVRLCRDENFGAPSLGG